MRGGLVDWQSNFVEARHLEDPLTGVIVHVVEGKVGHDLTEYNHIFELDAVTSEVVAVDRYFLIWR